MRSRPIRVIPAVSWYRIWIFLHCVILWKSKFTKEQYGRLDISPVKIFVHPSNNNKKKREEVVVYERSLLKIFHILLRISHQISTLRVRWNTFGPLGPVYIQGQIIESRDWIQKVIHYLEKEGITTTTTNHHEEDTTANDDDSLFSTLLQLHTRYKAVRPMTVQPP
eukprot:CAMPEP_0194138550 /NCGR_PEP_ID=MMETSP0152-20130528/8320_1 /TAXON_ID=1049557 /ORGANISM="Thalassiothrix antarctica, Strain L6-D1" /LENGTH=165 /DNA_ID=CAMNT_0038836031 /DNA_START=798 /DNA_END=1291 /DNA_ORIENTATION=+